MSEKQKTNRPELNNSFAQKELDKAEEQFNKFEDNLNELASQRQFNPTPTSELKMSQNEVNRSKDIYLKPKRRVASKEAFNEKFRQDYEFDRELVCFVATNNEVMGEAITAWTKPYPGLPAEEWEVPCGKPVWGPRYVAEQLKRKGYNRFTMETRAINSDGVGQYFGSMAVETFIQRLDAVNANTRKSIFHGVGGF